MIEPTRITDESGAIADFVVDYFVKNDDPLFLHVSYIKNPPHIERAFVITKHDLYGEFNVVVHKSPTLKMTPERNLDILQRDFPQFVEWYLFHPEYL